VAVNKVTPALFAAYPDAQHLAAADVEHVDELIRSIGLHRNKARNIIAASHLLVERHGGEVPCDREALEALPGVGRKTASVVLSVAFEEAAFAVDTHVFRVSQRLGLALGRTPLEIEEQVTALLPCSEWRHAHHWLILHGRAVCRAPWPSCSECALAELCPSRAIVARSRAAVAGEKKRMPKKASTVASR
jgi:endonuclease-3